jgi:hypothetical protein
MTNEHKPKQAWDTGLQESLSMALDEAFTALHESFGDLSDDDFGRYPIKGRHNVVTIVMHCLQQFDDFNGMLLAKLGKEADYGYRFLQHEERFELWGVSQDKLPKPGDDFPGVGEVSEAWSKISNSVLENVHQLDEVALIAPAPARWPRLCDPFFRAVFHTTAHIRQIWLLRGALGLTDGTSWPRQHWA